MARYKSAGRTPTEALLEKIGQEIKMTEATVARR